MKYFWFEVFVSVQCYRVQCFKDFFLFWMCLLFSLFKVFFFKSFLSVFVVLDSTFGRLVSLCSVLSNSTLEKLFNFLIQWFKGFFFSRFFLYSLFWIRRSKDFRFWNNVTRSPALIVKAPAATSTSTKRFFLRTPTHIPNVKNIHTHTNTHTLTHTHANLLTKTQIRNNNKIMKDLNNRWK